METREEREMRAGRTEAIITKGKKEIQNGRKKGARFRKLPPPARCPPCNTSVRNVQIEMFPRIMKGNNATELGMYEGRFW